LINGSGQRDAKWTESIAACPDKSGCFSYPEKSKEVFQAYSTMQKIVSKAIIKKRARLSAFGRQHIMVKSHKKVTSNYKHYNVLSRIEENFGLCPLGDGDGGAKPVTEVWK